MESEEDKWHQEQCKEEEERRLVRAIREAVEMATTLMVAELRKLHLTVKGCMLQLGDIATQVNTIAWLANKGFGSGKSEAMGSGVESGEGKELELGELEEVCRDAGKLAWRPKKKKSMPKSVPEPASEPTAL